MDRLPEWNERRLLAGGPEPAPKGWTPLSNVVRAFVWGTPPEVQPSSFERFAADVPADAEPFDLVAAALWAIVERCPAQAILTEEGMPHEWLGIFAPPPLGRRHETLDEYVGLFLGGYVGSGTADAKTASEQFGERLVGRPVLLRISEVTKAVRALGLADAFAFSALGFTSPPQSDEPKSVGRPRKVEPAAALIAARYPEGTTRPSNKVLADEVGVSPATISRALKAIQNYQNPFDNFARLDDLRTLKASLLHPNLEDADEKPVDPPA